MTSVQPFQIPSRPGSAVNGQVGPGSARNATTRPTGPSKPNVTAPQTERRVTRAMAAQVHSVNSSKVNLGVNVTSNRVKHTMSKARDAGTLCRFLIII